MQMLRKHGVVGKFVEFYGSGLSGLPLPDRATIANMAPEYGATMGFFPVDAETLAYLRLSGRPDELVALVEAYTKAQGLFRTDDAPEPMFSSTLELDLGAVEPCIAGPKRPQDRVLLSEAKEAWRTSGAELVQASKGDPATKKTVRDNGHSFELGHGAVVIAAITSCTNTSNPAVMLAAGLLARNAVERGLTSKPWVKTSLAPGSKVVTDYLDAAGVTPYLEQLGFYLVGYGCTTCIGNSGPLPEAVSAAINDGNLVVAVRAVRQPQLRGPHPAAGARELPRVAAARRRLRARRHDGHRSRQRAARHRQRRHAGLPARHLADAAAGARRHGHHRLRDVPLEALAHLRGRRGWRTLDVPTGELFAWDVDSTYVKAPPYFDGMQLEPSRPRDIAGARALALLGDSVTTDHISPAGNIPKASPAGAYLLQHEVAPEDFNSYGARRGNHEVMLRGTFANIRLRNLLAPGTEGGVTKHRPDGEQMTIFDASERYRAEGVPLVVVAGAEYGTGSSRDWAAKGTLLLGVRAVIAKSFERIHRSNLVGMGVLPLQFLPGEDAASLGLTGQETFAIDGIADGLSARQAPHRPRDVRRRRDEVVHDGLPHRHAGRGRLLQPRRHPPLRPAPAAAPTVGTTGRSPRR